MRFVLCPICVCAGLLLFFAGVASAESPYRTEIFGSIGAADYIDFNLLGFGRFNPGTHLNFGVGFGVRPFSVNRSRVLRMLGAEFEANGTRSSGGTQGYFTGNILFHASIGAAEPYFLVGGGVSRAGETHRAGDIGAGVKVFLTPRVSLRPELRAFFTDYIGNIARGSIAVGYHW